MSTTESSTQKEANAPIESKNEPKVTPSEEHSNKKKNIFDDILESGEEKKEDFEALLDKKTTHHPQFSTVNFNPDDYKNIMAEFEPPKSEKPKEKKVLKKKKTTTKASTSAAPTAAPAEAPKRPAHNARMTTAVANDLFKFVGHEKAQESVQFDMNANFDMKDFIEERKKDLENDKGLFD